ncbi:four-jointed box protein 1-like [Saccostrea echinata]|uniref:four-jointed box protein 1-like n=1 Tax=Saccostrea echinata TaxID=191078 RepID=UPI002A7F33F4|nr:four-jointed box protein 1-like [Saccostrea echinata]
MRKFHSVIMAGLAFTLGFVLGMMLQLPVITLPLEEQNFEKTDSKTGIRHESVGSARKQLSLDNPLRLVKPSSYGVVYPLNNGTNSYLQGQTDYSGSQQSDGSSGASPAIESVIRNRESAKQPDVLNGIFWSEATEKKCPGGFTEKEQEDWKSKINNVKVVKLENGCGRMQNRLATFKDASRACVRYRMNTDQIQGDIFSFYLSKLLGISNVPPSSLHLVNTIDDRWRTVTGEIANSKWADDKVVIFTQFVEGLKPSHIPFEFREEDRKLHPKQDLGNSKGPEDLCDLVQWSDLLIFDYLTANLDRVVNNMFNRQWNPNMMNTPAHNLERTSNGRLVFLDNESGLFHGYRLLDKYASYHKKLLDALCVFRNSTARAIERLYRSGNAGEELNKLFSQHEELSNQIPRFPQKNAKILQQRIADVYEQIQMCKKQYV